MLTCRDALPGRRFADRLRIRDRSGADRCRALALALCVVTGAAALLARAPVARADGEPQPTLPVVQLKVGGVPLSTEIASSGEQRYMGLSFREGLGENAGMLFVYPEERPLTFTMRNTLIPLSIAYITDGLTIAEILDMDVGPGQLFPSAQPARYALEVNQGWFERNGIDPGDAITMP